MSFDPQAPNASAIQAINAQASVLMKRGIALINQAELTAVEEALSCFDRALALRRQLPIDTDPALRYDLAACWLNRADALIRLGSAEQVSLAVQSYDEGIVLLQGLPLGRQ